MKSLRTGFWPTKQDTSPSSKRKFGSYPVFRAQALRIETNVYRFRYRAESCTRCGGVAQLARAFGSYPEGQGFKSLRRYHTLFPWRLSSAGRASALQAEGRGFDPLSLHHNNAEPWCRGLTCLPVTQETAGSNPVGSAIYFPIMHRLPLTGTSKAR